MPPRGIGLQRKLNRGGLRRRRADRYRS